MDEVDKIVGWGPIEKILNRKYKKKAYADGRPAYPALPLFQDASDSTLVQSSDPGLEEAVNHRINLTFSTFLRPNWGIFGLA